ncbi:MAG: hypothetical protein V4559_16115 [Pseudomonadota bacterium]
MPRKTRQPTQQEIEDFKTEGDLIKGIIGPAEPDNINVAQTVDRTISELGYDVGAEYADMRAECALHEEDREDWKDVARVIRERKAVTEKK